MDTVAEVIDCIQEKVSQLKKMYAQCCDGLPLLAYRGEPQDYGTGKLTPSLFRDDQCVNKESQLYELLCDFGVVADNASYIEKAIAAQHYAGISRMLDISFNSLVALYFACLDDKHDGQLFCFAFPEKYSPHSEYIDEYYKDILQKKSFSYHKNFKVFTHSYSNDRIKAQRGGFIFFPGSSFEPINEYYYEKLVIKKETKPGLRNQLDELFQISEATIYPEKDKIGKKIKEKLLSSQYSSYGLSVDGEVAAYFERLNYELSLSEWHNVASRDNLRLLRKERADLMNYIIEASSANYLADNCTFSKSKDELKAEITRNFDILESKYRED